MPSIAILAMVILSAAVAACAPIAGAPAPGQAAAPACETSTVPVTVGGQPEQATIEACPQPDGSWRITQTTPGLPPQVYVMPPPPAGAYPSAYPDEWDYFDYWPYWAAGPWPWFWGIGPSVVIVERFHHFAHAHPGGPGHPMPHGFIAAGPAGGGMHR